MAIITISRGTFSGGQSLAECVAEKLGYRCISREALAEGARQYGAPEEKLYEALTKKPGLLQRLNQERAHYLTYIRAALIKEARDEKLVYHGHAGHLLLQDVPHVLRVKVIANMEFRIRVLTDNHNLNREAAIEFIKKVDEERARWTRFLYHVDWNDPSLYDIVVNLEYISLPNACDLVCYAASRQEYEPTPESKKIMNNLVLSNHVRALIATDTSIGDAGIEVEAEGGVVTIGGAVEWAEDVDKIEKIVSTIPGVERVVSNMRVRCNWGDAEGLRIR